MFNWFALHLLFLIIAAPVGSDTVNSIDTIGRLKGIPSIHTNEGNKFCFSFLQNYEENTINILGIYIGTQENEEVQYSIKSRINGVARIGTVKPGQIKEELYQYTSYSNFETDLSFNPPRVKGMVPLRSISDYTGIIVETVDSSHKISVMGFSDGAKTSDGFTAVPMVDMSNIISTDYQYSVFTAGGKDSSIAAITTCDDFETAENVTVDATLVSQQGSFLPFNGSTLPFQSHYTSVITGSDDLLSSINVIATQPIGFMTGHECSKIPIDQVGCDHLIEQVPPSYTWGYNFLTAPFHTNNFGYILKLLPGKDFGTNFKIFCTINATVTVDTTVKNFVRTDRLVANRGIFSITTQSYCTIQSNKPLAVMQYATSHPANDSNSVPITSVDTIKNIGDPAMVWVPAVSQYLNKYLITNDVSIRSQSFTSNGIYVTVLPHCFNASAILDNGIPLENNASNWDTFHCDDVTDICGYGVSLDILQGTHLLKHIDSSCSFGAIMFGWGYKKGYAYPAGFGMRPIGVTFYSIEPLISSAPESGLVSVTVYRSGDLSEASSVQVGAFMSSKPNAATIGEDLESRTETVYFVANEFSATVNFTFINDYLPEQDEVFDVKFVNHHKINIGTPQVQELTILGDSPIVTGGGSSPGTGPNVVVQEGDSEVKVCITLSGLADSSYPEPVEFLFTPMEKSEALQPAQDEDYDNTTIAVIMPPGDTEVCAHISTVEDMIYNEPNEQFCINVTSNVSVGIFYPAQCQITVTIIDIGTRGSIDISRRLKGIPKSNTTEGNRFCLSFFEPPIPTIFLIKIGTLESFPVKYHISSGVNGINKTNTVEPGSINTEQYRYIPGNNESRFADDEPLIANMTIDFFNSRDINDFTGIEIKTVNSSHKISVTCFSKTTIRDDILYPAAVDSFVAVPIFNVGSIAQQYNYSMFNQYGNDDLYSQTVAAIVACDTIAAGGITLGYSNTSIPGHYFGTLDQRGLRSSQIKFKKYYTPYIPSSPAGTDVYATQPIGFMIGHTCLFYKSYYCDYLIEQVPPSYTWGYNFLIGPFRSLSMYSTILKFLPSKEIGTNFKIFCANSTSVTINVLVQNFTKADHMVSNRGIFNIGLQDYCTVQSNKPLAVMLYLELFQLIRKSIPDMVWIPPVSQYLNRYLVTIDATSYSFYRGVYVTVLPHCFDASAVLDNGIPLESNASNWHTFHCDNITDSCGYGIPVHMRQLGTHLLEHTDPSCSFGAIMFDFRYGKGYAYPAGFGMRPIGVTFYSIEPLISSAPESGLVSVNVYRSGDVSEASSVQVGTFMSSKSNAAMIGEDLESQTKTINFAANEFLATVNFSFLSDSVPELDEVFLVSFVEHQNINIGTPSEVELTILGVESNILKFTADNYCVHEGNTSVYVCVEKSRDTVDSVSLKITAMEDSIPSAAENIFDFVAETKTIDFPGPSKQACAQFQIIQDPFVDFKESIETFNVNFTATGDLGSGQMMATDKSIVTIYESLPEIFADSISGANNVFVPESQENVTVCVNRTFNFSCTRNVTFRAMDSALSINAKSGSDFVAETKEMPFTSDDLRVCAKFIIINDDIVEKNESFLITVMAQDHIPTVLTINITITDEDDAAVISFTNDTYTFPENIDLDAQVCVETTKELSDDIRINFTTRSSDFDGAATADSDYISKSETKTLRSGSRTVCINIEIKPDVTREPTEFFYVQLEVLNLVELMNNSYYGPSRLNVSDSEPAVVYITDTSVTGCESVYADLILLISESSSMQENQFTMVKDLGAEILNQLPIGKNMTHAGIVRLSNSNRTQIISPLGNVTDLKQLKQIVRNISMDDKDDRGLATHLNYSMILAMTEIKKRGRPNSRKIIVIITDGLHSHESWPYNIARNARALGYDIFAVRLFTDASLSNWEELTGYKERVLFLNTFNSGHSEGTNFFISQICNIISVSPQLLNTIGEERKINVGETVSFNCTADGVPVPDLVWRKDGKYIIPEANRRNTSSSEPTDGFRINDIPQVKQRTSELIITDLTVSDTGKYSCRADNGVERGVVLHIPYHLTVEGFNETNFCLDFPCKNDGTCQSLASTYICNCPETHTGRNCQERVRFTVRPKIIEFRQPVNTQIYSSVNFTCKAIGSPAPSIHWYKNNKLINSTDPYLLMFNDLSLMDRGVYHCEARSVINGANISVNTTKVLLNIEDVHQYKAIMSLSDDFYDRLNESEFINGTIQQLVKDINYNLSGRIIGNFTLFFIELLNSDEIYPDDDPENVSLLITLIANNQTNWLNQHIADDLGNLLGSTITDVVRFDGCPTSSTTLLSDSGDPKLTLTIKWPETNIGEIAVVNCPCGSNGTSAGGTLNASRNCGGDFTNGALWQAPSVLKCKLRDLARMICQLKDRLFPGVSYASVIDMLKELKSITSNSSEIGYTEVAAVVSVLEAAAEFANTIAENTMLITSLFEVIDNILAVNQEILIECQALSNSSSRILAIISNMAAIINVTDASTSRHVIKSHRYFAVSVYKSNFEGFGGQTLSINLTDFSESNVNSYNITLEPEGNIVSSTGSVTLPSNILNSSNINRITNAVYFTDSLFLRRRSNYFDHDVSSIVISASILRDFNAIKELESPVNLSFQLNPNINGSFPQCVFWDQSLNSGYGDWSSDNCNTSYDSVTQAIKCFCNHLTSFAVIQDVSPTEPSTEFRVYYLDSVSYIGIIISIICLIITIVLYLYNKDLRLSNHSQMLLNHCFALIGLYLSFVTSIHARNINSFCAVSGFMLQFFFLVCLSLMSAEVIGLYINIVMNSYMKMFYIKVTLVSWIAPIFIVIFCFSPSYTNYIKYSSNFCRAFDTPFYIGIVIPFIITYSFIWIVFIIIVISLLMSSKIKDSNKKTVLKPSYKYQLTKSLAHSTLFCLSSVLMLLMTEDTFTNKAIRDLVASLFVLLTGCHGLFLFIVHCLCTKDFYCICKKVSFGIKSLLLHTVQKKPSESTDRIFDDTMESTNQYLETILNSNMCQENISSNLEQLVKYSISASQIKLQEAVGQGEFGIVYRAFLATDKDIPQVVAVKTLKGLFSRSDVTSIVEESLIMSNFDHPNVLSLIGVSLDLGPAPCIIMPFMSRGSLLSYLKNDRLNITITDGNDEEIILNVRKHLLSICLQVANGMCYLASKYFVHRDLAARNCMIDNNGVIKVADFGLSEEVYTKTYFNQFKDKSDAESVKLPIKWMAMRALLFFIVMHYIVVL
ncbi:PREDICTED: uncharacterized protein LOC100634318 [Amphimedon queenslandica]|uniref:receptor protein-tyrosine kinase n=2 Tax=Amphimedon queenslandica TaxID=400682 RepID=A0AAN0J755_AMPQE|nr:PREDICTED: uncharacterized protein LOC100634318 [Amphimedon queenslandica]|eukprot:XP_019852845.1 PREDICTED: uncharacterized protein LOC100634318 [Amphimedon queenslandica]